MEIIEETKWFEVEQREEQMGDYYCLRNIERAKTETQAWEKTFEKWGLIKKYAKKGIELALNSGETCGLCNRHAINCMSCGIVTIGGSPGGCMDTPYTKWKEDNTNLELIDEEIRFLEDVYKKEKEKEAKEDENR